MRGTHIFMLVVGIGLGMVLSNLRSPSPMAPLTQSALTQDSVTVSSPRAVVPESIPSRETSKKYDVVGRAPEQPRILEELHRFQWEESLIAQMEAEWDALPRYAVAEETTEGWRVHLTPDDRLFTKVGLKSGDLITHEGLRAELADPARAPLANRVSAILSHIRQ